MATTDDQNKDQQQVPGVTDNVASTPRLIKYGAVAILAIGVGVASYYMYINSPANEKESTTETSTPADTSALIPQPFAPNEDANLSETGAVLREAADAESVEPVATGNYSVTDPQK